MYKGKDTSQSPGGYRGRIGIYEVLNIDDDIMDLIMKQSTSSEIEKVARSKGMINMQQDGYLKALTGMTTIDEVNRVASSDI